VSLLLSVKPAGEPVRVELLRGHSDRDDDRPDDKVAPITL